MLNYIEKAQHIIILSSAYGSPIIPVFPILRGRLIQNGVYKFQDLLSNPPRSGRHNRAAAATDGVTNVSCP